MNIGKAIKLCRNQKNLNQTELAKKSKISVSYLSLLEQGKRDPNLSTLEKIGKALDMPLNILFFLGAEKGEFEGLKPEIAEKLSHLALQLLGE